MSCCPGARWTRRPTASSARWRTRSRRRPGSGPNGSARRSTAGAQFVQTQFVFDVAGVRPVDGAGPRPRAARAVLHPGRASARSGPGGRWTSCGTRCPGCRCPTTCTAGCARSRRTRPPPRARGSRPRPSSSWRDRRRGRGAPAGGRERAGGPRHPRRRRRPGGPRWTLTCGRRRSCGNPPRPGRRSARSWRRSAPRPPTWPGSAWSATGSSTSRTSARPWSAGRSRTPTSRSPSTCAAAAI